MQMSCHDMVSRDQSLSLPYLQDKLYSGSHALQRKSRLHIASTVWTDQHLYQLYPLRSSCMTSQTQQSMSHWHTPHMLLMVHCLSPQYRQHTAYTGPQKLTSKSPRCTSRKASTGLSPSRPRQ